MKKLKEHGFHLWLIPLIIVILGAVGYASWYVWDKNKTDDSVNTIATTPTPNMAVTVMPTDNLEAYNDDVYGIGFNYPSGSTITPGYDSARIDVTSPNGDYSLSLHFHPGGKSDNCARRIRYTTTVSSGLLTVVKASDETLDEVYEGSPASACYIIQTLDLGTDDELSFIISTGENVEDADGAAAFFEQIANTIRIN